MKKVIMGTLMFFSLVTVFSESYLNATESDPNKLGWMKGFPPKKEKTLKASDGSFFEFPQLRYSVNHMREFFPTRLVPAAKENYFTFKSKLFFYQNRIYCYRVIVNNSNRI